METDLKTEFLQVIQGVEDEDLEGTISKFILDYPKDSKEPLILFANNLSQINENGTKNFDGMRKLKVLIALNNLGSDLSLYDQVLSNSNRVNHKNILSYFYSNITKKITQIFSRINRSAKYDKHNHNLTITYTSQLKEK